MLQPNKGSMKQMFNGSLKQRCPLVQIAKEYYCLVLDSRLHRPQKQEMVVSVSTLL